MRFRGVHSRSRRGGQVHRVYAVLGQQVGRLQASAVPRSPARRVPAAPGRGARAPARQRHRPGVARAGLRGQRGLHLVHDAALLLHVQPAAADGGREPQGVPVRRRRAVAAGPPARRRRRRRAHGAAARRARQQEGAPRRHGESSPHGEPADDPHRRLTRGQRGRPARLSDVGTFTARRSAASAPPPAPPPAPLARAAPRPRVSARAYSQRADDDAGAFSHLDAQGRARMVDVGDKPVTVRAAEAECLLHVGARLLRLLRDARLPKGDALTVAQVAGAMGAKRTAELIPLCHPLALDSVRVRVQLPRGGGAAGGALRVHCEARATARTGVEMEALTGAAVAALALYDMCKSVDRAMRITDLRVLRKTGGRSDVTPPPPDQSEDETYAPPTSCTSSS